MNQIEIFMPPPAKWQDFQILIADVAKSKYISDSVQEYGRQGQKQDGVDVYAVDFFGNHIGIQCKETKIGSLTTKNIDEEIAKAKNFKPALNLFIVATTHRIDAKLQAHINILNSQNGIQFKVQIWFWDNINQDINRSSVVMESIYKTFREEFGESEVTNHLNALRLSFDRPAFTDNFLYERNYQDFEQALVATKAMLKTGFLYDNWSKSLVGQTIPSCMIGDRIYQKFLLKVENKLEKIYDSFLQDKQKEMNNPNQLNERAGEYNIKRRSLIEDINKKLKDFHVNQINIKY